VHETAAAATTARPSIEQTLETDDGDGIEALIADDSRRAGPGGTGS
jgi:hypothetical protein